MTDARAVPPVVPLILRIFAALGAMLLVGAAVLVARESAFLANSVTGTATVSRIETGWMSAPGNRNGSGSGGNTGYRVVATLRAPDGRSIEVRSPSMTSATSYRVGDPIEVNYPPGRPEQAQFARFVDRWMLPLVLGGIGAVALGISLLAWWLLRQPGTRVLSNGMGGFRIVAGSPQLSKEEPLAATPPSTPVRKRGVPIVWLGVVLVAGIVIGLVAARHRAPDASVADTAPKPGWPSQFTVQAPPSSVPQGGSHDMTDLTMAARAFLARPAQDAAMQAALREQVATLGIDCPGIVFTPGETLLAPSPPPSFDAAGTMLRGLIRQRFLAANCPGRSAEYNVWIFAPGDDAPVRTIAGFPGTTRADVLLLQDATPIALGIAARLAPGCTTLRVSDTHLVPGAPRDATSPWSEDWLVTGCGKRIALTVRFIPDAARGMTRIEVPADLARLLPSA